MLEKSQDGVAVHEAHLTSQHPAEGAKVSSREYRNGQYREFYGFPLSDVREQVVGGLNPFGSAVPFLGAN